MSEKRRGLGRGLGALIPTADTGATAPVLSRPRDVFFADAGVSRETAADLVRGTDDRVSRETDAAAASLVGSLPPAVGLHVVPLAPDVLSLTVDGPTSEQPHPEPIGGAAFAELPIDAIRPNARQPRAVFDEDELAELASSIRQIGLLQPIVVRPIPLDEEDSADEAAIGASYEIVMGERRWRACREAGVAEIPAIIRTTGDDAMLRDALLENLHRAQLNPLEEGAAYQQLLDDFGCTHEELATRLSRSRPQVTNTIRLLRLPAPVARRVAAGVLSAGHARALLALEDPEAMERLAARIVAEGLSVRSVEEIVAVGDGLGRESRTPKRTVPGASSRDSELDGRASILANRLDTRVSIAMGRRKGKLTVEFASVEDLDRILDALGLNAQDEAAAELS